MSQCVRVRLDIGGGLDPFSHNSSFNEDCLEGLAFQGFRGKDDIVGVFFSLMVIGLALSSPLAMCVRLKALFVIG